MKRYFVVQFLTEEGHAWDIAKDIRGLFGKKVHSVNCIPYLEGLDSEALSAPPQKEERRGRPSHGTAKKDPRGFNYGGQPERGGQLRKIIRAAMQEAGRPLFRREISNAASTAGMSSGNVSKTLDRMEGTNEIVQRTIKGKPAWELVNGSEEKQAD